MKTITSILFFGLLVFSGNSACGQTVQQSTSETKRDTLIRESNDKGIETAPHVGPKLSSSETGGRTRTEVKMKAIIPQNRDGYKTGNRIFQDKIQALKEEVEGLRSNKNCNRQRVMSMIYK